MQLSYYYISVRISRYWEELAYLLKTFSLEL